MATASNLKMGKPLKGSDSDSRAWIETGLRFQAVGSLVVTFAAGRSARAPLALSRGATSIGIIATPSLNALTRMDRLEPLPGASSELALRVDPDRWVDDHGDCLYRYALIRVRKQEVAEDLVQETLLAAMRQADKFSGRSSERSWLCGILKNKICDYFRRLGQETNFADLEFFSDESSDRFDGEHYWIH